MKRENISSSSQNSTFILLNVIILSNYDIGLKGIVVPVSLIDEKKLNYVNCQTLTNRNENFNFEM